MATEPSNILLIISDSLRSDALGCYGNTVSITPNIDKLSASGLLFKTCYSTSPLCVPARSQLLSGRYCHETGNLLNPAWQYHTGDPVEVDGVHLDPNMPTLPAVLTQRNYFTAHLGKNHFYPRHNPYGFHHMEQSDFYGRHAHEIDDYYLFLKERGYAHLFRDAFGRVDAPGGARGIVRPEFGQVDRLCPYVSRLPSELQTTPWLGDRTRAVLRTAPRTMPFFIVTSFYAPHDPFCVSEPYDRLIDPASITLPKMPEALQPSAEFSGEQSLRTVLPEDIWKKNIAHYHANVHLIDQEIGRIVEALQELGRYEDTLIIITSDHGDTLGEHGIWGKNLLYEDCARVPLICHHGGGKVATGITGETATLLDLYPTILACAGASDPRARRIGRPLELDAAQADDERTVIGELANGVQQFFVRSGRWKYIRLDTHEEHRELYDLETDPDELINLAESNPGQIGVMEGILSDWLSEEAAHWRPKIQNINVDWSTLMTRSLL